MSRHAARERSGWWASHCSANPLPRCNALLHCLASVLLATLPHAPRCAWAAAINALIDPLPHGGPHNRCYADKGCALTPCRRHRRTAIAPAAPTALDLHPHVALALAAPLGRRDQRQSADTHCGCVSALHIAHAAVHHHAAQRCAQQPPPGAAHPHGAATHRHPHHNRNPLRRFDSGLHVRVVFVALDLC